MVVFKNDNGYLKIGLRIWGQGFQVSCLEEVENIEDASFFKKYGHVNAALKKCKEVGSYQMFEVKIFEGPWKGTVNK